MSKVKSIAHATGWLTFSVFFNILNTIVYSTLFPKYLESLTDSDTSFSVGFSIMNTLTTLFSAIALPFLGSFTDQLNITRLSLVTTSFFGWIITVLLIFIVIPLQRLHWSWLPMIFAEFVFILAMFFLRVSVMNNNALLTCFEYKSRSILSILGNCLGFSVNLIGLGVIRLWPDHWTEKLHDLPGFTVISTEGWWIVLSTTLAGLAGIWMILSPSGSNNKTTSLETVALQMHRYEDMANDSKTIASYGYNDTSNSGDGSNADDIYSGEGSIFTESNYSNRLPANETHNSTPESRKSGDLDAYLVTDITSLQSKKKIFTWKVLQDAFLQSILRLLDTIWRWRSNAEYYHSWLFLLSYVFIAAPGVVFTVIFTFMFIAIFPELKKDVHGAVDLNLYYKIFMVIGVFFALFFDKLVNYTFRSSKYLDMFILFFHTIVFQLLMIGVFLLITFKVEYHFILWTSMIIGFIYSWNASVTRGFMSKLIPMEKKGEFMGFYSTFTYLGVTFVSGIDSLIKALGAPSHILLLLLFIWSLPGYIFLFILFVSLKKQDKNHNISAIILKGDDME